VSFSAEASCLRFGQQPEFNTLQSELPFGRCGILIAMHMDELRKNKKDRNDRGNGGCVGRFGPFSFLYASWLSLKLNSSSARRHTHAPAYPPTITHPWAERFSAIEVRNTSSE
jgi:hypothetical protein